MKLRAAPVGETNHRQRVHLRAIALLAFSFLELPCAAEAGRTCADLNGNGTIDPGECIEWERPIPRPPLASGGTAAARSVPSMTRGPSLEDQLAQAALQALVASFVRSLLNPQKPSTAGTGDLLTRQREFLARLERERKAFEDEKRQIDSAMVGERPIKLGVEDDRMALQPGTPFFGIPGGPSGETSGDGALAATKEPRLVDMSLPPPPRNLDADAWMKFQQRLFEQQRASDERLTELLAALASVPPLPYGRRVHEGIVLGMWGTQMDADLLLKGTEKSPFTCKPYKDMHKEGRALAFGFAHKHSPLREGARVVLDDLTKGGFTLSSEDAQRVAQMLRGTTFDRLLAYSNGATLAEGLIRSDIIRVEELNILGGDRSLINGGSLKALLNTGRVGRIVIWINPGDPVPILTANPVSREVETSRAAAEYFTMISNAEGTPWSDSRVEYRRLNGPQYRGQEFGRAAHDLSAYLFNIRKWFGCSE